MSLQKGVNGFSVKNDWVYFVTTMPLTQKQLEFVKKHRKCNKCKTIFPIETMQKTEVAITGYFSEFVYTCSMCSS